MFYTIAMLHCRITVFCLIACTLIVLQTSHVQAKPIYEDDLIETYTNDELGFQIKIPGGWKYKTSGKEFDEARDAARKLTSDVFQTDKKAVTEIDKTGSEKNILIRMRDHVSPIPAVQITTKDLTNMELPPEPTIAHLKGYMNFVANITYVSSKESVEKTELNGIPCAHVSYDSSIYLENYTYLAQTEIYSFLHKNHFIDLVIIKNRNSAFTAMDNKNIQVVLDSFQINP